MSEEPQILTLACAEAAQSSQVHQVCIPCYPGSPVEYRTLVHIDNQQQNTNKT